MSQAPVSQVPLTPPHKKIKLNGAPSIKLERKMSQRQNRFVRQKASNLVNSTLASKVVRLNQASVRMYEEVMNMVVDEQADHLIRTFIERKFTEAIMDSPEYYVEWARRAVEDLDGDTDLDGETTEEDE